MAGLFTAFLAHAEILQVIVHCKYTPVVALHTARRAKV